MAQGEGRDRKATVLIVDDERHVRVALRASLARTGFLTLEAVEGRSGFEAAVHEQPDVILLDIDMPGVDGIEALTMLKSDERVRAIPVLLMTNRWVPGIWNYGRAFGAADVVEKPSSDEVLLQRVRRALGVW